MISEIDVRDWDKVDCKKIRREINEIEWQVLPDLGVLLDFVNQVELIQKKQVKQVAALLKAKGE